MRAIPLSVIAALGLLVAGCASLSPEEEARHTLMWEAARECQERYRTIRVRHIDSINKVIHFEDYAQAEAEEFMACFNQRAYEKITGSPPATPPTELPAPPRVECPPGTYWMGSGCTSQP